MKFQELKVDRLKRELNKLELPTTGNKAELQKRLLEEFQQRGIDIDSYEFDDEEMEVCEPAKTGGADINSLLSAMMKKMEQMEITSRAQNRALVAEVKETSKVTNEKLAEISTILSRRVEGIETRMADLETAVEEKFNAMEETVDGKLSQMDEKINSLQCQQVGPVRVVPEFANKIKTPCFDGSIPLSVFKLQFETVANRNGWDNTEKALELILALKGTAAEVLQTITASSRNNYEDLMVALQRKFGDEHKRDLYQMELRCRAQKANETLQAFAMEIERLVQLTYPGENHPLVDRFKTEAFVNGIRDPEVKLAVCATQKTTFAETVAFALAQETARVISKPQVHKVRTIEVESDNQHTLNDIMAKVERIVDKLEQKANVKCYNCGRSGHFQKNCKMPRKRARSISPARNNKRANHKQPSQGGDPQEKSFQTLRALLCAAPVLSYPVPGEKFVLDSDASGHAIGGVLSQVVNGTEQVVGYYSRTLSKQEKNYCVTRRELLAVLECIKHYHKYLYGQHFVLRTDHSALRWLLQFKNPEGQLARWIERLQSYDFSIEHRKGVKHGNADALSRRPCNLECKHCIKAENKESIIDIRLTHIEANEDWSTAQRSDPVLSKIIAAKEKDQRPTRNDISAEGPLVKAYWAQWNSLRLIDGCLYRTWESADGKTTTNLIVVPSSKMNEVLNEFHNGPSGGHLGVTKTLEKLKQRFYWVGSQQAVADWIANCAQCIAAKGPVRRSRGQMQQYNSGAPFERIAMDVAGPFPVSNKGNRYVLVVMDYFSKWPEVYAIPNQEATTVVDVFVNNWVCRFGVPIELHSDQGRNFESTVFKEMCKVYGIKKTRTTPLHPQSDGMVERFNRTLEEYLRKVVSEQQKDWDEHIPKFLLAYRSAVHNSTARTPAKIIYGTELKLPADLEFGIKPTADVNVSYAEKQESLNDLHDFVRTRIKLVSDRMKARYDKAANTEGYNEGQLVLLYNPQRKKGLSPKLQTNWDGPYKVIKRLNDVVYRIQKHNSPRSKMKVVHLERLADYGKGISEPIRDEQA